MLAGGEAQPSAVFWEGREICRLATGSARQAVIAGTRNRTSYESCRTARRGRGSFCVHSHKYTNLQTLLKLLKVTRSDQLTHVKPVAHSDDAQAVKVHQTHGSGARKSALYVTKRFLPPSPPSRRKQTFSSYLNNLIQRMLPSSSLWVADVLLSKPYTHTINTNHTQQHTTTQ